MVRRYRLERRGHGPCQSTILAFNCEQRNQNKLSHDDLYAGWHLNCVPPDCKPSGITAPSHSQKMAESFLFHPKILSYKSKLFNKSLYVDFQQTCDHWHSKPGHSMLHFIYYTLLLFQNMNFTIYCITILSVIPNCCSAGESTLHHRGTTGLLIHFVQL